jgi:Protein of unknown function (DUF3179)
MSRWMMFLCLAFLSATPAQADDAAALAAENLSKRSFALFTGPPEQRRAIIDALVESGRKDAAPILILALRFAGGGGGAPILMALEKLTGEKPGDGWDDWMRWQEAHPETGTIPGFGALQASVFELIDPNFKVFLTGSETHDIRLEEITWGGVIKDGIPALTNPKLIAAANASYLNDSDLVFGISINGDVRAYPLRILDWHEMFNDVIGGVPVSLAYCTLCGSGILFETTVAGQAAPFVFGSSGFLYRSNKLMYDQATHSLWNQFTGRPVVGTLNGSGIELKTRPVVITQWGEWKAQHADSKVLALETGYKRDYGAGAAYSSYFDSDGLMFPTNVDETRLKQKDYVFALRGAGTEAAWPLKLFEGGAVINDRAGVIDVVLIGDAATRTVRAFRSEGQTFEKGATAGMVKSGGGVWSVTEDALIGPDGKTLARLPGHIAYWFAWNGYYGKNGKLGGGAQPSPQ